MKFGDLDAGITTTAQTVARKLQKRPTGVVLIEDTGELQCSSPNLVALRTRDGVASLSDLIRSSLRGCVPTGFRSVRYVAPRRIDLLKAWVPAIPETFGTIHAGTARIL
jgi:type IV secretion system protein VirB11